MNFEKMLEYQRIDQEILALENEVNKSKERANLALAKNNIAKSTDIINGLKAEATSLLASYNAVQEKIEALKAELDEYEGVLDGVQDVAETDYHIRKVSAINDSISALEKEVALGSKRIDEINEKYKKTWDQGVKDTALFKSAKADYDKLVESFRPQVAEKVAARDALKGEIPEKMFAAYTSLRNGKKLPAFVPFDANKSSGCCPRCGMEVANDTLARLKSAGDFAECPNCRRILFIPEK
ncbi:MAG: hypothetical protein IJ226_04400 [Clostridia bacterium]|nr:hypothetical protein [Clostridia bacterium]